MRQQELPLDGDSIRASLLTMPGAFRAARREEVEYTEDDVETAVLGGSQNDVLHRLFKAAAQAVVCAMVG